MDTKQLHADLSALRTAHGCSIVAVAIDADGVTHTFLTLDAGTAPNDATRTALRELTVVAQATRGWDQKED